MTMEGSSRQGWAAVLEALTPLENDPAIDLRAVAGELYAVAETLAGNPRLARALGDKSRDAWPKRELVRRVLGAHVSPVAMGVVEAAVSERWRIERDLTHALERAGHDLVLSAAQHEGNLDQVERELLAAQQLFSADEGLRDALHRIDVPAEAKAELVTKLLAGKALPDSVWLAQRPLLNQRGRRYAAVIWQILSQAARLRDKVTAHVTSATPLSDEQVARLAAGLTKLYGYEIFVDATVDPDLVGGLLVKVGDEVIDATVDRRLAEAGRVLSKV
ncbi:MAG: F0F1 ATP synthase subunit delta [Dermatophilus congolensis]|nr:F0F1 ATP synthase subunit delta [Dermatophilus congolensis]